MKKSILTKYFLLISVLLLISFIILGGGLSLQVYRYSVGEKQRTLEHVATRVSTLTTNVLSQSSPMRQHTFQLLLSTMMESGNLHAILCDTNGKIFATSDNTPHSVNTLVQQETVDKVVNKQYYSGFGTLGGLYKGQNYTIGVPYYDSAGRIAGCVFVTTSIADMRVLLFDILRMFLFSALTVFLLGAILSYFSMRKMIRPIRQISKAAKSFAHGDYTARVQNVGEDEIGELTHAFNNMADSIEKSEQLRRTFVANVSHELRSPMTSIGGYVDGILDGTIPPEREHQYLEVISSEVRRLSRLVSRMLNITRIQATDMSSDAQNFDFCEQVRRVIIGFDSRIEEKCLDIDINFANDSIMLFANEDSIFQVVYNLTENAIKFATESSVIAIEVATHAGKLWFSIRNRGETIPADELPYVFDRFHKIDRSRANDKSGLGLGLYIVKTIINQHHGDVGVSSLNGDTEFYFSLPLENKRRQENRLEE